MSQHLRARVERFRHQCQLESEQDGEEDGGQPLDPRARHQVYEAADDGADQETGVEGQDPQAEFLATLEFEEEVADGGHADCGGWSAAKALEEAGGHVAAVITWDAGANGAGEGDDGAGDEDDAAAVDVGQ